MTNIEQAQAELAKAQGVLEQVGTDIEALDGQLASLQDLITRVRALGDYYQGDGQAHIAAILEADPEAVTPLIASEDAVWEVMAGLDDRLMRLLRIVTAELTANLDNGCV